MAPREQVNHMAAATYFKLLATLMKKNPPAAADLPIVGKMAKIGIIPGRDFDPGQLDPAVAKALEPAAKSGLEQILAETQRVGKRVNRWQMSFAGKYGTDHLYRAATAFMGLGANLPQDAIYPLTQTDGNGQRLNGANRYILHFENGKMPPVNGFWSLTMYNAEYFFVENLLNRYTLSERNKFNFNPDGSVDIYLQHEPPIKNLQPNWLPAPEGDFALVLRIIGPRKRCSMGVGSRRECFLRSSKSFKPVTIQPHHAYSDTGKPAAGDERTSELPGTRWRGYVSK